MSAGIIMIASQAILGSISGSINASTQQTKIKSQVCQIAKNMDNLVKGTNLQAGVIDLETEQIQLQNNDLAYQIMDIQNSIKQGQKQFKMTYNIYLTVSLIVIILIAFLLFFKKVILKATTSRN
jgi:hypothetical protein